MKKHNVLYDVEYALSLLKDTQYLLQEIQDEYFEAGVECEEACRIVADFKRYGGLCRITSRCMADIENILKKAIAAVESEV